MIVARRFQSESSRHCSVIVADRDMQRVSGLMVSQPATMKLKPTVLSTPASPGRTTPRRDAADVHLAHRALQAFGPIAALDAKACVLVRQRVGPGLLFPPTVAQRHAGGLNSWWM
jgi:hypothetical protein